MLRQVPDMSTHARRSRLGPRRALAAAAGVMSETDAARTSKAADNKSHRRTRFRTVYEANYHRVLGFVLRRTANREDAEDVVAETFLTAWRRLEQMPAGGEARLWLYGVARRALANQQRGERRRVRLTGVLHA